MDAYLTIAHEVLALALFWTCFSRAIKTSAETTRLSVIVAFWIMGLAAVAMIAAPIVIPGWVPDPVSLLFLASVVIVQWVTSGLWKDGLPCQFKRPAHEDGH